MKERALAAIASELDVQITDIKSKWNAVRKQFGRELNKVKYSESGQSTDDLYVSQWDKLLGQALVLTICDEDNKKPRYTFDWQL